MGKYWLLQRDVQVSKTLNGYLCRLLNRNKLIGFEQIDDGAFVNFLDYIKRTRSYDEIITWGELNSVPNEVIDSTLNTLLENGLVISGNVYWDQEEESRLWSYFVSKSNNLDQVALASKAWSEAKVAIVGCGGVGMKVAKELASMGVKNLVLIDPDVISSHNLTHQSYSIDKVGQKKVEVLADELHREYKTNVTALPFFITEELSVEITSVLSTCSIVAMCADEPSVDTLAEWVTPFLTKQQIPHIVGGGYHGHSTSTGTTIIPGDTACWKCFDSIIESQHELEDHQLVIPGVSGSFNPLVSILANFTVSDIIAVITKLWEPLLQNRMGDFDLLSGAFTWRDGNKKTECSQCAHINKEENINVYN
ncbi:ThiF family adenylyltransferase [Bacillus sp. AG4(2022)]|uniref:ThiF family adenylyltransferase n=1 Tax=Bacillus sp. AG4(2022) TaxID=2962594 RepID=UPI002881E358|nr:ThiF family adenylyltransferase [Bacillus sp. AG4(2022)]MDT0161630.1 ThiF family adenylyltransferase [Bacillus sp. AG4(2022)]